MNPEHVSAYTDTRSLDFNFAMSAVRLHSVVVLELLSGPA
jgi:hypothetical protein